MELELKNIGIIKDSKIQIDGLTVITGHNNTGKSTIGKALFSIIAAVEDLESNSIQDKALYATNSMRNAINMLELFRVFRPSSERYLKLNNDSKILEVMFDRNFNFSSVTDIVNYTEELIIEVNELTNSKLFELLFDKEERATPSNISSIVIDLDVKKLKAIDSLNILKEKLLEDPQLIMYANTRINKMLNIEFNEQIQPVKSNSKTISKIRLAKKDIDCFDIEIVDNKVDNRTMAYLSSPFSKAILIDDVYILDHTYPSYGSLSFLFQNADSFSNAISCLSHNDYLLSKLDDKKTSAFEDMINEKVTTKIINFINQIFPVQINNVDGKMICSEGKLDVRNLATGSKMFAIIKMLLERGHFSNQTVLILDEPESHLHPEWQNVFAEVVVLLVKEIQLKVLLTTHSPNFLLALDVFTQKYNITNKSHFYNSKKMLNKYFVDIECIDKKINEAYVSMSKPFIKMDALRSELLNR